MGSDRERPEERFTHIVQVDGFWIDQHEVTNAEFDKFVKATGYITLAERGVDPKTHPGMSQDMLATRSVIFIPPTELSRGGEPHPMVAICEGRGLASSRWSWLVA